MATKSRREYCFAPDTDPSPSGGNEKTANAKAISAKSASTRREAGCSAVVFRCGSSSTVRFVNLAGLPRPWEIARGIPHRNSTSDSGTMCYSMYCFVPAIPALVKSGRDGKVEGVWSFR